LSLQPTVETTFFINELTDQTILTFPTQ